MIVDDHPVVREGLAHRLERQPDMTVCCETGEFAEALHQAGTCQPDVVVVDLTLKGGHGLDLIKRLRGRQPYLRILVWSIHPDWLYAERALQAGAMGYVTKDYGSEKIVEAIHSMLEGKVYLNEAMAQRLLSNATNTVTVRSPLELLSDRELETFELLGQGLNTTQIAGKMRLSPKTVETFRARIKEKLKLRKGSELLQRAMQWAMENKQQPVQGS